MITLMTIFQAAVENYKKKWREKITTEIIPRTEMRHKRTLCDCIL